MTRTSLIVDPPDGRVPALTPEGQARVAARAAAARTRQDAHPWEPYGAWTRCITRGVIKIGSFYSSSHEIIQAPGYVVILQELIHEARIVPLKGQPHIAPAIRQWMGDARGRWEGDTLVVETTNFTDMNPYRGSGDTMRLVERFTRVAPDAIDYQFTVDDPTIFTRSWTVSMPMTKGGSIFEYACHEGNYAMGNMLAGISPRRKPALTRNTKELTRSKPMEHAVMKRSSASFLSLMFVLALSGRAVAQDGAEVFYFECRSGKR